ncbi:MAG: PPC domain-containing protein [Actinomycetota bacterium]
MSAWSSRRHTAVVATLVLGLTISTDNEAITHVAASTGTYIARVFGAGSATNHYVFQLDARAGICPPDDGFEPNEATGNATPIVGNSSVDAIACPSNGDVYALPLTAGETVELDLLFATGEGDLDLFVFDPTGTGILESSLSPTDNEHITFTAPSSDTFFVLVTGFNGASGPYHLDIAAGVPGCVDDGLEVNNTFGTAGPMPTRSPPWPVTTTTTSSPSLRATRSAWICGSRASRLTSTCSCTTRSAR